MSEAKRFEQVYPAGAFSMDGNLDPVRDKLPLPDTDPRTIALEVLQEYVSELTFFRPGNVGGKPIPFTIAKTEFFIEEPDYEQDVPLPSIVVKGGDEKYDNDQYLGTVGFGQTIDTTTIDKFGKGTVLQNLYEHWEETELEIWASSKPERRSLIAGLQLAIPKTVSFVMRDYWNQVAYFTIISNNRSGDGEVVRGRRVSKLKFSLWFPIVQLVYYTTLKPVLSANVDVGEDGILLDVDELDEKLIKF